MSRALIVLMFPVTLSLVTPGTEAVAHESVRVVENPYAGRPDDPSGESQPTGTEGVGTGFRFHILWVSLATLYPALSQYPLIPEARVNVRMLR